MVDETAVNEKLEKGEALTKEEEQIFLASEPAVEGYVKAEVIPAEQVEDKEETAESVEKEAETAGADDKPKEPAVVKPKEEAAAGKEDLMVRLERELGKDEGKEDLKDFNDREKAYFHQMRRDRKARQKAESDRDAALFREDKLKKDAAKPKEEAKPDHLEALKKKDPTEYLTVAEAMKMLEDTAAAKVAQGKPKEEEQPKVDPRQMRYLNMCEKEAREAHPEDFDAVMGLTSDIIESNPEHLKKVAISLVAGENPALKAYELIKADPEFAKLLPAAQIKIEARKAPAKKPDEKKDGPASGVAKSAEETKKEKDALAAQKKLEDNAKKTKTTASVESAADTTSEGPSFDDIAAMTDREFARLPKKTREKYLKQMAEV